MVELNQILIKSEKRKSHAQEECPRVLTLHHRGGGGGERLGELREEI